MANYVGVHCPVCSKRFVEEDDIVVCPICGAPHHRECYQESGKCALHELHITGHTWQPPEGTSQAQGDPPGVNNDTSEIACPSCGAKNPKSGIFCSVCGVPLARKGSPGNTPGVRSNPFGNAGAPVPSAYTMAFGGLSPDEEIDEVSARDIALYVGENSRYFLPRFKQLSQSKGLSPNFAAFFFNFFYFFYRKMYLVGGVMLGVFAIAQIPSFFIAPEYTQYLITNIEDIMIGIQPAPFVPTMNLWAYDVIFYMRYVLFGVGMFFSLFANRFYMRMVLKNVRKIKASFVDATGGVDDKLYTETLARKGRISRSAVIICFIGLFAVTFVVVNIMTSLVYSGMQ